MNPSKRPAKGKGHPPPGDFIALGKQSRPGGETSIQKTVSSAPQGVEKKLPVGGQKREGTSLLAPGLAVKKPKILPQTQTFTPLGRPSEIERRSSPAPTINLLYEESAIDVEGFDLLSEILDGEESSNDERVEGLLCGAVKHLRNNRFKPDQAMYLTLMYLANTKPGFFNSDLIIEAFCSLLKRDLSINFKSKGNAVVSVLACNLLMTVYAEESNWPDDFVKAYVEDSLGERVWVDRSDCKGFVDNILTAFGTNIPKPGLLSMPDTTKSGEQSGPGSPVVLSVPDDEDVKPSDVTDVDKLTAGLVELTNSAAVFPRYPFQQDNIETFVLEVIREQISKRQTMDGSARNLIKLMTATCGYGEVRLLAAQKLEVWIQNPKLGRAAQELLMSVCLNCVQHDSSDVEVMALLIKLRMKTKPLINHYLNCMRELLGQHPENLRMVLAHTIYNELSNSRNPNNMSLLGIIFQVNPEAAPRILAEIFQDLLANKDDYLRALRALFREIVRSLRHDLNFGVFCLGLMAERTETKFTDMEFAFKERYFLSICDLVTLSILLSITPAVREAAAAIARGERKDLDALHNYRRDVAMIQRDAVWWLHMVVPKMLEVKLADYVHCLHKVLFMESSEHYYNKDNWPPETERGAMLRLASEVPILEDTLMRVLVIGLSRELPLSPADAVELAEKLIKRAANLHSDGGPVLQVERLELVDALLNLCAYRHPENIALPKGYNPPTLAISNLYWKAWAILLIISAFNPATFGLAAWENYPTLKCMMEMVMTNNYKFPPPTTATDDSLIEEVRNQEKQVAIQEKQEILEFETHLAASTSKVTITEANSLLVAQLTSMDPGGCARRPPQSTLDQLRVLNDSLKVGQMLCRSRNPDFLLDIIQRQGTSQSMPWLAELVESSEGSLDVLPVQCLCEFLLHDQHDVPVSTADDEAAKFERHKKKQKIKKQEQLLARLQTMVHSESSDTQTTYEVLDYFLKRLSSTQAVNRALATKGLSMVVSRSQISPVKEEKMEIDSTEEELKWLLTYLPSLHVFPEVKAQTCSALRQACQIETDPSLVSAYIIFLSRHALDQNLQELDELALDIAQLIVERTTVINYILPQEVGPKSKTSLKTLDALIYLFVSYLKKAREPSTEAYNWSNTQDQIILQWESSESATMHILVVHAMIILLTYGPADNENQYNELRETWFPESGNAPSAFLLDTSEEALLLPDWLKLRMIRSSVQQLVAAALQDLEPAQLLLFVQSFGIPVSSMSKLLQCLDNAVAMDAIALEDAVVDKTYMAQLIEVQRLRGAKGGDNFYRLLTDGQTLSGKSEDEAMDETPEEDSIWTLPPPTPVVTESRLGNTDIVHILLQVFDTSGRMDPDIEQKYQSLIASVAKDQDQWSAKSLVMALHEVLASGKGVEFATSLLRSQKACSLFKLLIAKQKELGEPFHQLMNGLSRYSAGQKSPTAAIIHQFLTSQSPRSEHKDKTRLESKLQKYLSDDKLFVEDLKSLRKDAENRLESMIGQCMMSSMVTQRSEIGSHLATSTLLQIHESKDQMLSSTAGLFVDWLELLDPEVIRSSPELQQKLLFAKKVYEESKSEHSARQNSQPYLLALLTHQSSWATLHRCINCLLKKQEGKIYDPTAVLDFLTACVDIPKLWQGREKKVPKNQVSEDVLGLNEEQIISLVNYIIEEAIASSESHDFTLASEKHVTISNRIQLLTNCLDGNDKAVKEVIDYVETKLKGKRVNQSLYQFLLLELYLRYPYVLGWLSDLRFLLTDGISSQRSSSQLDLVSHRLLTCLGQDGHGKKVEQRMSDSNIACRKLACQHPILILRQLPVMVSILKGKTGFTFGELRHRNLLTLFSFVLGLLEVLQPQIFQKEYTALEEILQSYFSLLQAHAQEQKQLAPLIVKFVAFLNQFVSYDSSRAANFLQKHVQLLSNISLLYPDLSSLKSLLAGITLPRNSQEEGTVSEQGETTPIVVSIARPNSPWTVTNLGHFLQKINRSNTDDVLEVLKDLDEASKRKIEILEHFLVELKRLMSVCNDLCRNTALSLVMRYIRQNPRKAPDFVSEFLRCLESPNPDIVSSVLTHLPEFTVLCQDHADSILQKAFTVGVNSTVDTSSFISETLQLLNLDMSV